MREYELTYLVSDDILEKDLNKVTGKISGIISAEGGKVSKEEVWGRRKLTYPINKQNFATYVTVWFEVEKEKIVEIEHELRVDPQIIRHLITVKIAKSEELTVTKEDIVETKDVEKVIGEKSFEVVEGETEASKDLMAVREKEEDSTTQTEEIIDETAKEKSEIEPEKIEEPVKEKKARKTKIEKEPIVEEPAAEEKSDKTEIKAEKKTTKIKKEAAPKEDSTTRTKDTQVNTDTTKAEDESERIKKLDEKLDELLGNDL